MKIIKRSGIEFREGELTKLACEGVYIVKGKKVLQPRFSVNGGESLQEIYKTLESLPLTRRGRFHTMDFRGVNSLLGFELLTA